MTNNERLSNDKMIKAYAFLLDLARDNQKDICEEASNHLNNAYGELLMALRCETENILEGK